jgi:hypothetical protein
LICNNEGGKHWLDEFESDIVPTRIIDVPSGDKQYTSDVHSLNVRRALGNTKREAIANAMWEDYQDYLRQNIRNSA